MRISIFALIRDEFRLSNLKFCTVKNILIISFGGTLLILLFQKYLKLK